MKPGESAIDRLRALQERYDLPPTSAQRLLSVLVEMESEHASVTTVRDPAVGAEVHVADSLAALDVPAVRVARRIADLGAGGGFPGLALAVALPHAHVTLVESVGRKCEFMTRAAGLAQITNATALHARAEGWTAGLGASDLVVARALAPLGVIAEYAAPLLEIGGLLVAYKGHRDAAEEQVAARAAAELGLSVGEVIRVTPYQGAGERHLHLLKKVDPTPSRFPRRAGMARKRPLGMTA